MHATTRLGLKHLRQPPLKLPLNPFRKLTLPNPSRLLQKRPRHYRQRVLRARRTRALLFLNPKDIPVLALEARWKLTSVSPLSVSQSGQDTVTLTGEGFLCAATITIGKNVLDGESDFVVVSNASLTLSSGLLPIGTFDIVIHDSLGNAATLPRSSITITR